MIVGYGVMSLKIIVVEASDEGLVVAEQDWRTAAEVFMEIPYSLVKGIQLTPECSPFLL